MEQSSWFLPFSDFDFSFTEKSKQVWWGFSEYHEKEWNQRGRNITEREERCEWSVPDFKGERERERESNEGEVL